MQTSRESIMELLHILIPVVFFQLYEYEKAVNKDGNDHHHKNKGHEDVGGSSGDSQDDESQECGHCARIPAQARIRFMRILLS
mgnify:CR=1 FL=1